MQLQKKMPAFEALGIKVLALSYDEPDALKDFQDAYGITYTLLSDPESNVIREYGILNTLIAEDDHPWFGIPFPGTYLTNSKGDISHKFFENNLVLRIGPEELLRAFSGEALSEFVGNPIAPSTATDDIQPKVFLEGPKLAVGVLRHLVCQIDVPEGRHLYADPAPEGMVPFTMTFDAQSQLVVRDIIRPMSEAHTVKGTGELIQVHHGRVELRFPITANAAITSPTEPVMLNLTGEVKWQTCDDEVCDVPQRTRFEFSVPMEGSVLPDFMAKPGNTKAPKMNGMKHFEKLSARRKS
ncbi:MAG: hypothetical protein ACJAX5_001175 [Patiriisocius sp.]